MPDDSYTPTFDPKLSGKTPRGLLYKAGFNRHIVELHIARGCSKTALDFAEVADWYERELEERWLAGNAPVVRIYSDAGVSAPGHVRAWREFIGSAG